MDKLGKILVVDDDSLVLEALHQTFIDDYDVIAVDSGEAALNQIRTTADIDAIVLDIRMAKMDGLVTASVISKINSDIPIIFHTGYPGDYAEGDIEKGYHPFDYVRKNERPERLKRAVKNAVNYYQLKKSHVNLIIKAQNDFGMVGKSQAMLEVYQKIEKIGPTDNKVMILGETGTGKELVARALHKRSLSSEKPLIIFNCNHKAPDLVESELFGHLRGSFTGAYTDQIGLFEAGDTGTIFLDEIGDLDITTQAKILRVLETGEMQRIGSPEIIKIDVRLICATNHDLEILVTEKIFRKDLYYRIKGVTVSLSPLRERKEDIPELIDYFAERYCMKSKSGLKVFEQEGRDYLLEYNWPGNVRQLQDTIQSLIDLTASYFITKKDVESYLSHASNFYDSNGDKSFSNQVAEFRKFIILKSLDRNKNNVSATARQLSLDPSNLRKIIKDLNINIG